MVLFDEMEIDGDSIRLPSCGRVVATTGAVVPATALAGGCGAAAGPPWPRCRATVARWTRPMRRWSAGDLRSALTQVLHQVGQAHVTAASGGG